MQFPPPRSVSPFRNNLTPNLNNQFVPSQPLQNLAGRTSPILGPSYPPNQPIGFPPGMPINSGFIESARPNIINGPRSPMPINPLNNGFPMRLQPGIHQDIPIGYPSMGGIASMPMGAVPIGTSGPFRNGFQRPQPSYIGYKILDRFPQLQPQPDFNIPIQVSKVYCVICEQEYLSKDKQEHALKHLRPVNSASIKKFNNLNSNYNEITPQLRPIVQPQEYNIQYDPKSFIIQQQTLYSTPPSIPYKPQKVDYGVGTTQSPSKFYQSVNPNNNINNVIPTQPTVPSTYPHQSVRLTNDGQNITYNDPNMYQGGRIFRPSQSNSQIQPQVQPNQSPLNDTRFSRNTFIGDEPSPAVLPENTNNTNRQTLQYQDPRSSQLTLNNPQNSNSIQNLPQRPTVLSQQFNNQYYPFANNNNLGTSSASQNLSNNTPINPTNLATSNNFGTNPTNQNLTNSYNRSIADPINNLSYRETQGQYRQPTQSIIDDFGYTPNPNVIPRNTVNRPNSITGTQIPFDNIISEKIQ